MKKFMVAIIAVMMMAFSAVSAFAVDVESPVASTAPETQATTTTVKVPDKGDTSPKTGSGDTMAYALIAAAVLGCGAASVALVKMAKKN